jgi:hypothetical protein
MWSALAARARRQPITASAVGSAPGRPTTEAGRSNRSSTASDACSTVTPADLKGGVDRTMAAAQLCDHIVHLGVKVEQNGRAQLPPVEGVPDQPGPPDRAGPLGDADARIPRPGASADAPVSHLVRSEVLRPATEVGGPHRRRRVAALDPVRQAVEVIRQDYLPEAGGLPLARRCSRSSCASRQTSHVVAVASGRLEGWQIQLSLKPSRRWARVEDMETAA